MGNGPFPSQPRAHFGCLTVVWTGTPFDNVGLNAYGRPTASGLSLAIIWQASTAHLVLH